MAEDETAKDVSVGMFLWRPIDVRVGESSQCLSRFCGEREVEYPKRWCLEFRDGVIGQSLRLTRRDNSLFDQMSQTPQVGFDFLQSFRQLRLPLRQACLTPIRRVFVSAQEC